MLVVTVLVILVHARIKNVRAIRVFSEDVTRKVEAAVIEKTGKYLNPAPIMIGLSARIAEAGVLSLADSDRLEAYAIEVMKAYPQLTMFNIGDEQGNFLMPKRLPDGTLATKVIDRTVMPPTVTWKYRDEKGEITRIETSTDDRYDPRVRPSQGDESPLQQLHGRLSRGTHFQSKEEEEQMPVACRP